MTKVTRKITTADLSQSLWNIENMLRDINNILYCLTKDCKKEDTSVLYSMKIVHRFVGYDKVTSNENSLVVPYELNNQILELMVKHYETKKKELEDDRDNAIQMYIEDNKKGSAKE